MALSLDRHRDSRDRPSPCGLNDGGLGTLEQPLDSFTVVLVAELPCELEDPCSTSGGKPYASAAALDLGVSVLVGTPLGRRKGRRVDHRPLDEATGLREAAIVEVGPQGGGLRLYGGLETSRKKLEIGIHWEGNLFGGSRK
ncbi:hypothetical protein MLD38_008963 [Melastoma candidum]|uniref:Uncharacterized protein n=1 Tax=Melastoma candidum TaxID=119954 RepID=A0ACB9RVM5_9MYRT|nr:hypothetical protein MLD38_008963 [Melastoma candidum]